MRGSSGARDAVARGVHELVNANALLSTSFGPLGFSKLLATSSGALTTSKRLSELLPCTVPAPGAATWVLDLLKDASCRMPDGGQAVMLALTAALQQAEQPSGGRKGLLFCLADLKEWFLLQALPSVAKAGLLHHHQLQSTAGEPAAQVVQDVLHTMLATATDRPTADTLAAIAMELLQHVAGGEAVSAEQLVQAARQFQAAPLLVAAPGRSLRMSGVLPGVVLPGSFSSHHAPAAHERVRFVVLRCPLDPPGPESWQGQVLAQGDAHYRHLLDQRGKLLQQRLLAVRACHPAGVNMVLLSEAVTPECSALAQQLGLALLPLLEPERLTQLCAAAGIEPVWSPDLASLSRCSVGESPCVEPLALNPAQPAILLHMPATAATLMLCAPSDQRCQQVARLLRSGISLLADHATTQGDVDQDQPLGSQRSYADAADSTHVQDANVSPALVTPTETEHAALQSRMALEVVPGGGAFELLLAAELEAVLNAVRQGAPVPECMERAVARHGHIQVAGALEVLLAAALAVPKALAASGAGSGAGGGRSSQPAGHARSVLLLMTKARESVRQAPAHGWGFVVPALAAVEPLEHPTRHASQDVSTHVPGEWGVTLGQPAAYGVLELLDARVEVWRITVDMLVQVLRVGGVAAAARRAGGGSSGGLVAARDWGRRQGVQRAASRRSRDGEGGGTSDGPSSDSSD